MEARKGSSIKTTLSKGLPLEMLDIRRRSEEKTLGRGQDRFAGKLQKTKGNLLVVIRVEAGESAHKGGGRKPGRRHGLSGGRRAIQSRILEK